MKFKDVAISDASTEAKVAALAVLLDKELLKLAETVLNVQAIQGPQGEQGLQGPKGEQGDRGFDGTNGKDGSDGKDGKDGEAGKQGVGVADAKIDFDGSLVITLTDGTEINAGEVVPLDTAEKIRVIGNGGGTSQSVLDAIAAIQATIATYGTMATQNANNVAITGGAINNTTVGSTSPAAGTFTTLTATGQTSLGGAAGSESLRVLTSASAGGFIQAQTTSSTQAVLQIAGSANDYNLAFSAKGTGNLRFLTNAATLEQMRVSPTASAVNYVQVTGSATLTGGPTLSAQGSDFNIPLRLSSKGTGGVELGNPAGWAGLTVNTTNNPNRIALNAPATGFIPTFSTAGVDTNAGMAFISKGTGAIDLAAGSSGVNISNGGTVTAITRTATGNGSYTSKPTITISAPTTAGGVQATATIDTMGVLLGTVQSGGTGYTVGDSLSVVGGTGGPQIFTVATVSGGVVTGVTNVSFASYSVTPTNPVSTTGGTGTGCTLNLGYNVNTAFTITNAGSGYVEQPTVSFSGGGGSGAAAYATVGSGTTVKSIGSTMSFSTPSGEGLRLTDTGGTTVNYWNFSGGNANFEVGVAAAGTNTNIGIKSTTKGTGAFIFTTNNYGQEQMRVSHTASAVNYVQVTGAATANAPALSFQGSDTNISGSFVSKGSGTLRFLTNTTIEQLRVLHTGSAVNYGTVTGAAAGAAPVFGVAGSDTNIDLTLTPKGTGNVRFGTYTATISMVTGYIEIKDSGGTVRKLAVVA